MHELCPRRTRSVSLCEALDRVLNTGVVALGEIKLSVANVDLVYLGLQLVVTSIESGRKLAPPDAAPQPGPNPRDASGVRWQAERDTALAPAAPGVVGRPGPPKAPSALRSACALQKSTLSTAHPENPPPGENTELVANAIAGSDRKKNGLGQLVLTLMKLLHELLERQALRRIEGGALTPAQVERLGVTLMNQAREIERLRRDFGLPEEDLNLDLGPLGKLL